MKNPHLRSAELLASYARTPSVELRNQLVKINAGLVRKVAYQISRQSAEPYEDLSQVGYIGLILAIERFDASKGYAFSSFAIPYIRGEILNFIRDRSTTVKIPRRWQELHRKGKKARQALRVQLGYQPSEERVAEAVGVSPQEWRECKNADRNRFLVSLDATVNRELDRSLVLEEMLVDPRDRVRESWQEERLQLQGAMRELDKKTQVAIELVFLRDLTRKEAAKRLGVSTITVSRHLKKGIDRLAGQLQPVYSGSK